MNYTVITENDVSQWLDKTGAEYHFPKRYAKHLTPETVVVYYKGKLKDTSFRPHRLSDAPHYFGVATIETPPFEDNSSDKGDLFVKIENFTPFDTPINIKDPETGDYIEEVLPNRVSNHWRDGVRPTSKSVYERIVGLAGLPGIEQKGQLGDDYSFSSFREEGGKKQVYSTRYERDKKLRDAAIQIHGDSCKACGFNFGEAYGQHGQGFIHVHHVVPVSEYNGKKQVDPSMDLVPLCANCHAMVHRRPNQTLSMDELKALLS
ncbi:putative restriction endonuclease [Marinobacter daqiaonensis]|uniref:Putative restriction endonuclease n=1 Tax=Marinobacter daqiaonensis TaxID=650891 RepID=A0A1I6HSG9_9GAMM|nr:HNH endonuclease [Marinobacter daqiaonensis]SFR57421.1 putative restriction endonuclease [Marinobacter daqiaonensis]